MTLEQKLLQHMKIPDIDNHVYAMISLDPHLKEPGASLGTESVRFIWSYVLEKVMRQGGPFGGEYKSEMFDEVVNIAMRLFPGGIPGRSRRWVIPEGVSLLEYGPFLRKVLRRTAPTPISG